jgi:hypothetical protein
VVGTGEGVNVGGSVSVAVGIGEYDGIRVAVGMDVETPCTATC